MSTTTITFEVHADLERYTDQHLAALWHISQANPAPFGDKVACDFAEHVAREIIRRFLASTPPELWVHQGRHIRRPSQSASDEQKGGAA